MHTLITAKSATNSSDREVKYITFIRI